MSDHVQRKYTRSVLWGSLAALSLTSALVAEPAGELEGRAPSLYEAPSALSPDLAETRSKTLYHMDQLKQTPDLEGFKFKLYEGQKDFEALNRKFGALYAASPGGGKRPGLGLLERSAPLIMPNETPDRWTALSRDYRRCDTVIASERVESAEEAGVVDQLVHCGERPEPQLVHPTPDRHR